MKLSIFALSVGCAIFPSAAWAEHHGPACKFMGIVPTAATTKIADECKLRGFEVNQIGATDVSCQGGELVRNKIEFRPSSPAQNPNDAPQSFHRFSASEVPDGTIVQERSTLTLPFQGHVQTIDVALISAMMANKRVKEFCTSLGGVVEEVTK